MLFKAPILEGIGAGRITLAFRRWTKPTVRAGGTLRTAVGVLAIDDVRAVRQDDITEADARLAGFAGRGELLAELQKRSEGTHYRIAFHRTGDDPRDALREREAFEGDDIAALSDRLARLDRAGPSGKWTTACLQLIGEQDGRTASELAGALGMEKATLKRKIRQLKELGLTESLQSGYRLSPRGRAYLKCVPGE